MSDDAQKRRILDERAALVKDYEIATQHWIHQPNSRPAQEEKRAELTERLRTNYWRLDPYLRARTLYDRTGIIGESGKISFYESSKEISSLNTAQHSARTGPIPAGHGPDDLD